MKKLFAILVVLFSASAFAAVDLRDVLIDIRDAVSAGAFDRLSPEDKERVSNALTTSRDILYGRPVTGGKEYYCMKGGSGYYYVMILPEGREIGGAHNRIDDCRETLPAKDARYTCLKNQSGYFQIYALDSGKYIGGNHNRLEDCKDLLPK